MVYVLSGDQAIIKNLTNSKENLKSVGILSNLFETCMMYVVVYRRVAIKQLAKNRTNDEQNLRSIEKCEQWKNEKLRNLLV